MSPPDPETDEVEVPPPDPETDEVEVAPPDPIDSVSPPHPAALASAMSHEKAMNGFRTVSTGWGL
jgi:hypothetical protein